jgi:hypothetical protein
LHQRNLPMNEKSESPLQKTDLSKFGLNNFAVKRLHNVFICSRFHGFLDMVDVVFGCTEHDHGTISNRQLTEIFEKIYPIHHRHIPIKENGIRHFTFAYIQCYLTVLGFDGLKIQLLQDFFGDHSYDF